jgi:hypothetical protein
MEKWKNTPISKEKIRDTLGKINGYIETFFNEQWVENNYKNEIKN